MTCEKPLDITRSSVRFRHVFFFTGFDPQPAARYHALYSREAAQQSKVNGMAITVGPRLRNAQGNSLWSVHAQDAHGRCETVYEYVRWDDIVRACWPRGGHAVTADAVRGAWAVLRSGELGRVWRLAPRTLGALLYAFGFLLGGLVLSVALGFLAFFLGMSVASLGPGMASLLGLSLTGVGFWAFVRLEARLHTTWMARILAFSDSWAHDRVADLQPRLDQAAAAVARALRDEHTDEVLVVGISVGSMLAVSVAARALRLNDQVTLPQGVKHRPVLSLLTLGHCIPLLGLMRRAASFRADLVSLAAHTRLRWRDFSSPTDWVSFGLTDPVAACGLDVAKRPPGQPQLASPRFHTLFEPDNYRSLVKDKIRLHRQYIMSSDRPGTYDYFAITAGSLSLAQRFPLRDPIP